MDHDDVKKILDAMNSRTSAGTVFQVALSYRIPPVIGGVEFLEEHGYISGQMSFEVIHEFLPDLTRAITQLLPEPCKPIIKFMLPRSISASSSGPKCFIVRCFISARR